MVEGTNETTFSVHGEIACGPNYGRTYVASKNRVFGCEFVDHTCNVLGMNRPFVGIRSCQVIQIFARLPIVLHGMFQVLLVLVLLQLWKQCSQRGLRVSNETNVQLAAASQVLTAKVNLDDSRVLGIEIPVWKVRSEHQQDFAVRHGVVAGGKPEQAGQADVIRVVVFNKFFAAQGMHNRSLELAGNLYQLCMGSGASRAAENGDLFRSIQKFGKDIEFFVRGTNSGF